MPGTAGGTLMSLGQSLSSLSSVLIEFINSLRAETHISHSASKHAASKYFSFTTLKMWA